MSKLAELIGQAGPPISRAPKRLRETPVTLARERLLELEALLHLRDGFVALGGALTVRPSVTVASVRGVEDWNQLTLWRTPYRGSTEILFFADTVLGLQFGLHKDSVVAFDPASGQTEHVAFGLERWAAYVLEDSMSVLGSEVLAEWVAEHGSLPTGKRLQPRLPARWQEESLDDPQWRTIDDVELMRRFARLYKETREHPGVLPEGFDSWWWEGAE
ncbi:hypothetical protein [Paraliomyxa miuraensis]|uniref:hypothetical protein n=1 Tax=Paraliomyxa miuraensis TaxID=376150 RepID=UPI00225872CE|nr:hypothetical protein [Paraliomyxa miuraensis]MCX4247029.1 hypothetical protein [Paraliomyxa miuraensis]